LYRAAGRLGGAPAGASGQASVVFASCTPACMGLHCMQALNARRGIFKTMRRQTGRRRTKGLETAALLAEAHGLPIHLHSISVAVRRTDFVAAFGGMWGRRMGMGQSASRGAAAAGQRPTARACMLCSARLSVHWRPSRREQRSEKRAPGAQVINCEGPSFASTHTGHMHSCLWQGTGHPTRSNYCCCCTGMLSKRKPARTASGKPYLRSAQRHSRGPV